MEGWRWAASSSNEKIECWLVKTPFDDDDDDDDGGESERGFISRRVASFPEKILCRLVRMFSRFVDCVGDVSRRVDIVAINSDVIPRERLNGKDITLSGNSEAIV